MKMFFFFQRSLNTEKLKIATSVNISCVKAEIMKEVLNTQKTLEDSLPTQMYRDEDGCFGDGLFDQAYNGI